MEPLPSCRSCVVSPALNRAAAQHRAGVLLPAATATAFVMPETVTGTELFVVVPLPSWPYRLHPQH